MATHSAARWPRLTRLRLARPPAPARRYSSMLGKKGSVKKILRQLREGGVKNVVTTEFLQGHTSRWGVGWCFAPPRPEEAELRVRPMPKPAKT